MKNVYRYHPLLVSLHWLLAVLILFQLITGDNFLAEMSNDNPGKISALKTHIQVGLVILFLMLTRLILRRKTDSPDAIDTGNSFINKAGKYSHILLYILIFGALFSGIGTSIIAGLPDIVFFGSGDALPETFDGIPPMIFHAVSTQILFFMIILHLLATIYHQFVRKDGLLSRMWFGKR